MARKLAELVRRRAGARCEYCHIPADKIQWPFQLDHIVAQQHGGATEPDNLALSCMHCNKFKGPNVGGLDPQSGEFTRLFHPRRDSWAAHFRWKEFELIGTSPIGRTTVVVLNINDPLFVAIREELAKEGVFPA
jgi:HNH endonuclease